MINGETWLRIQSKWFERMLRAAADRRALKLKKPAPDFVQKRLQRKHKLSGKCVAYMIFDDIPLESLAKRKPNRGR